MKLDTVARLIEEAVREEPPDIVAEICGDEYVPYYSLLYLLAQELGHSRASELRDCLAVELGVHKGRGSSCLAGGSRFVQVVGIDHTRSDEVSGVLDRFSNFAFLKHASMPVPDVVHDLVSLPIDVLHIDTEHSYGMAQGEFVAYQPLLAEGAVVLFDDLHACDDGVLKFFAELSHPKIQDDRLHPVCGYGVLIYE